MYKTVITALKIPKNILTYRTYWYKWNVSKGLIIKKAHITKQIELIMYILSILYTSTSFFLLSSIDDGDFENLHIIYNIYPSIKKKYK